MASFTAKSATSDGRVLTFGASLEPVRSVSCTFCSRILANIFDLYICFFNILLGVLQAALSEVSGGI